MIALKAGTAILMADGGTKAIERLKTGDAVLAADGSVNRVAEEISVWNPGPRDRSLGFLCHDPASGETWEQPPFMGDGHFLYDGFSWLSFVPARGEFAGILPQQTGILKEGSMGLRFIAVLDKTSMGPLLHYRLSAGRFIIAAVTQVAPRGTYYRCCLAGGHPSFWADGIALGVTVPVLTADTVARVLELSSGEEKEERIREIDALMPRFRRIFGEYVGEHINQRLKRGEE